MNGQIQIFTKPGSDKLHGSLYGYGNDSSLNALNPFVTTEPAYHSSFVYANVSGADYEEDFIFSERRAE